MAVQAVLAAAGHTHVSRRQAWPAGLTDREVAVLRLLARGASNRAIVAQLTIAEKTVSHHIQHIYDKIDVSTRAAAALFAMQHNLRVGEVVKAHENACLVLRIIKMRLGPQLLPTRIFTLASVAGGTQLVCRSEVRTGGLMRLLQPLLPSVFRRKKATYLAVLKTLLEQVGTTSGVPGVASAPPMQPN